MKNELRRLPIEKLLRTTLLFVLAFYVGRLTVQAVEYNRGFQTIDHANTPEAEVASADESWGSGLPVEGQTPVGNATVDYLKQSNSYHCQSTQDEAIHLTLDADYKNGNIATVLDALKRHNVPATFSPVGSYLETSPDPVKRMVVKGHTVGNHTSRHLDMPKISTKESFRKELNDLKALLQQITGQPVKKYHRLPQGKCSEDSPKMVNDMGYRTFFWSFTCVDWYEDKQPLKGEAFRELLGHIHPDAVALLHSTPKTSAQILDEPLTKWEKIDYRFGSPDDLVMAQ